MNAGPTGAALIQHADGQLVDGQLVDEDELEDDELEDELEVDEPLEPLERLEVLEVLEPGDVVAMLLDRVEAVDLLDEQDVQDLAQLLGQRPARRLSGVLNRELRQAQRSRPRRSLLQGLTGREATGPVPAPDSVSGVLLRIESGQRLDRHERARLAGAAGRPAARVLEHEIRTASGPRGRWDR